jgi:hypothetical protein
VGVGVNWVHSAPRPLIGLLCQPWVIMMENVVEWLPGKTEVLGENLSQCCFVHHKPHMSRRKPGLPLTNHLSFGMALPEFTTATSDDGIVIVVAVEVVVVVAPAAYLTFLIYRPYSVRWMMMNWKWFRRKHLWPNWGTIRAYPWWDWGKPWKTCHGSHVPAKIRTDISQIQV